MDNIEIHVAEIDQRQKSTERNVTSLWDRVNNVPNEIDARCERILLRSKEYTDAKNREAMLKMAVDSNELAEKIATKIKSEVKESAWSAAKIVEWAFKAGMAFGIIYVGVNQAHAMIF